MYLNDRDVAIVWAALQAMVNDIHAPQDEMGEAQWARAEELLQELDSKVDWSIGEDEDPPADWIGDDMVADRRVISEPGAAIEVTEMTLTPEAERSLTISATSLGKVR